MTEQKNWLVKTGDFFFKYRNYLFPLIIAVLFISFPVPGQYFGRPELEEWKDTFAIAFILSGLAFRSLTIGWAYIKRGGMNKEVYADTLVKSGLFGVCRNPLYVGNMMVYIGVFILHGHPIVVATGIALYTFIYVAIIAAEEFYLRNKFGAEFSNYCNDVPRWLPRFGKYRQSIQGMNFSFRRSILKDYSTIFNAVLAIALVEGLEHYHFAPPTYEAALKFAVALLMLATVMLVTVKYIKKKSHVKV
ncbi:MAG: phospholipid methyltransferase [Alphaproteobacteria bacterium]|jgi:protein-S-isoprenylcysteine O-methyltransferase Ste14|nr:phospholipid methyltransferase [Alphaproteobacteria bacterium]